MLIPQTVSLLYDLSVCPFYHAWVNEFIAHMVHQHSLRPLNKLQCPLVPHETCCSLLALNLSHITLLCFYWMCFFKAVVACLSTISSNGSTSSFMEVYTGLHPSCYSLNNLFMLFHNNTRVPALSSVLDQTRNLFYCVLADWGITLYDYNYFYN